MKKSLLLFTFLILFLTGCGYTNFASGPVTTETESIPIETDITEGAIEIHFGVGTLHLSGETNDFFSGSFTSNDELLFPNVNYKTVKNKATLLLKPQKTKVKGNVKNEWNVAFTNQLPLSFKLNLGVGENNLTFDNLYLKDLSVHTGVGETIIDLSNVENNHFNVDVNSGVGSTKLLFSENHAVVVDVRKGIGSVSANGFVVEENRYKTNIKSDNIINVTISQGVGEVILVTK
ncbi:hypothetical protein DS745_15920 [Anaerobacillus alkaliphilus]|uniref:DUF2154 domain-containing protein n=1 Tax=Anaerobacillus alkaliphilus TaxID=1548597 RepID=A0A4Q0VPN5_9BACI|nr:toast rack family protein [Anaerobacillus alkaliphilus]RXI97847.1 hypothetical protein DS745_15920 [Anaerobacillus alkaliphilus]